MTASASNLLCEFRCLRIRVDTHSNSLDLQLVSLKCRAFYPGKENHHGRPDHSILLQHSHILHAISPSPQRMCAQVTAVVLFDMEQQLNSNPWCWRRRKMALPFRPIICVECFVFMLPAFASLAVHRVLVLAIFLQINSQQPILLLSTTVMVLSFLALSICFRDLFYFRQQSCVDIAMDKISFADLFLWALCNWSWAGFTFLIGLAVLLQINHQ